MEGERLLQGVREIAAGALVLRGVTAWDGLLMRQPVESYVLGSPDFMLFPPSANRDSLESGFLTF